MTFVDIPLVSSLRHTSHTVPHHAEARKRGVYHPLYHDTTLAIPLTHNVMTQPIIEQSIARDICDLRIRCTAVLYVPVSR